MTHLASDDTGCITAVPAANDNIPSQLRALGAAIGKWPEGVLPDCDRPHWHPANDNLPPVVAFTGLAGSGKSTATRYLVERHGYTLVKFAGPLKDVMRLFGLTEDEIEGSLKEKPCNLLEGKTPRHAMQTLGTQWARDCIGPNFWARMWRERAVDVLAQGGRVVVDDLRFPNEAQAVRHLGGDIYRLVGRGGIPGQHESERGCGDEDLVIANDNTPEELFERVEEALRRYG
jgi:hypothetical protein